MYCENCGKNYANIKYTQIVNGNKTEMHLCEECSRKLGIEDFNIPMDFSTFLGDIFSDLKNESLLPELLKTKELKCTRCNSSFEDFINTGRFGCEECYSAFEEKIDPFLRNLQGANRHVGRLGKIEKEETKPEKEFIKDTAKLGQIYELNKQLKTAIKEEKYEEAAKLRDEIRKLEGENK